MGEIRVKVRLTNAGDIVVVKRGMMDPAQVRSIEVEGVVDTGAVRMVIPVDVMKRLGVDEREQTIAEYADGRKDTVPITDGIQIDIMHRGTIDEALVLGDEVLIGQTVLEKLDLMADCRNQRLVPNHPNQAVSKVR